MFTITNPGFFTTVQDCGRWGYQAYGMPVAGVMDRYAYRAANLLVGNKASAAVIEMTLQGASFAFDEDQLVALCGADMQAKLDGVSVENWSSFAVNKGSELKLEYAVTGCRAYLAVRGGINVPSVLGSRSTYTRAKIGGLEGRAFRLGDVLAVGDESETAAQVRRSLDKQFIPCYDQNIPLRILLGPQDDMFMSEAILDFLKSEYVITDEADRMGYRLSGPKVTHVDKADIVSDALPFGAVQVPSNGQPIIMMADRQTTGGYAKIGTVIGPDMSKLAQAKPGDAVYFKLCSDKEAITALEAERQHYVDIDRSFKVQKHAPGNIRRLTVVIQEEAYEVQVEEYK